MTISYNRILRVHLFSRNTSTGTGIQPQTISPYSAAVNPASALAATYGYHPAYFPSAHLPYAG